ncbi:MAG: PASTA domain-containing protein [Bacteroidota bacterium]
MSIKVGIFFGGPSREREISFAGGRTVYDNLDKALFEPVPIFVDSFQRWYLLDWQYLYRGTIRDFFPPIDLAPKSAHGFQVYQESLGPLDELSLEAMGKKVGRRIRRDELPELVDVAFLALHGEYGEDGKLQRELEYAGIPYTGSGVEASEIGMDKAIQKELMVAKGFASPNIRVIAKGDFDGSEKVNEHFAAAEKEIGWPMVIRPARQGSSIGVAILEETDGLEAFERAVNAAFFRELLPISEYVARDEYERLEYVRQISDLRDGIAFPMDALRGDHELTLYTPDDLHDYLEIAAKDADGPGLITFTGHQSEERVIVESFIDGKEFSCIVVRTAEGTSVALPPTEIVKPSSELFDYRSKYMPGRSRKVTPIELPADRIQAIREECERLFEALGFHVYARIDGFHTAGGGIYLNDPNTTSGMMPSSFFFHQAAEIGLNPSQFLTFIIRASLRERGQEGPTQAVANELGQQLDAAIDVQRAAATGKERVAVLLGGTSFERHISVESGRNIYEKLASSEGYRPVPIFLTAASHQRPTTNYQLFQLPINLLLKDNADDIRDKLAKTEEHPVIAEIRAACSGITERYADADVVFHPRSLMWEELPEIVDGTFIALHGRPGEDGQVQALLEPLHLYYNGSGIASSQITIDKYQTLDTLGEAGLSVTDQYLAQAEDFHTDETAFYDTIEAKFAYPLIAKPVDDGCSSAVKLIKQQEELHAYCRLTFQPEGTDVAAARKEMKLSAKDEWPVGKDTILFERAITQGAAEKFLEITGGMLTHRGVDGEIRYEIFEPSETLAGGEVLSLEEKFLAGEGQNLTPARLGTEDYSYDFVAGQVKADLERAARAVGVEGYCRIDAFVRIYEDGRVETLPIEVNSLPGMTPATAIFHQAALAGYQPAEFIAQILQYGKSRLANIAATIEEQVAPLVPSITEPVEAIEKAPFSDPFFADDPDFMTSLADEDDYTAPATAPETSDSSEDWGSSVADYDHLFANHSPVLEEPVEETTFLENPAPAPPPEKNENEEGFVAKATNFFKDIVALVKSSYFWKNALGALLFFVLCFLVLRTGLNWYTAHGKSTELPNFVGMMRADAEDIADDLGLTLKFEKGAFDPNRPAGEVVLQHPKAGAGVKKNRSIYLTVLSDEAPMIKLPSLVGNYDYTNYANRIEAIGDIRSIIKEQVYDPKQEENTILHLFDGETKITDQDLRSGYEVPQGSTLEFVVTVRQTGEVSVPNIKCKRFGVVEFLLDGSDLLVGNIYGDVSDRSEAFVIRTEPAGGKMVPVGSKFDIYLSQRRPDGCD